MAYTFAGQFGPEAVITSTGAPVPLATVTVYEPDGHTKSSLYTSRSKSVPIANPTLTDSAGNLTLFTTPGQHVVTITASGVTRTITLMVQPDPGDDVAELAVGQPNGLATLDGSGHVPVAQLRGNLDSVYVRAFTVADATGVAATDTAAIQTAVTAAAAIGGTVQLGVGQYHINAAINVTGPVVLTGMGRNATALLATSAVAAIINCTATAVCVFAHMTLSGNSLATNCHLFNVTEGSIPHIVFDVQALGATGYQFVNNGCEDTTYLACTTSGDESHPTTVANAVSYIVPNGAGSFVSCQFFGQVEIRAQQFSVSGGAMGPLYLHNAGGGSQDTIFLDGVYVYDGGLASRSCITSADGAGLPDVSAKGCYFVAQVVADFVTGGTMGGGGSTLSVDDCSFAQTAGLGGSPVSRILNASAGTLKVSGGGSDLTGTLTAATSGVTVRVLSPLTGLTGHGNDRTPIPVTAAAGCVPIPGKYHTTRGVTSTLTFAGTAGDARAADFHLQVPATLYRIGCRLTTAGDAGSLIRLCVYDDLNGVPGALLVDAGTVPGDTAAPANQEIILGTPLALAAQRLWLVAIGQNYTVTPPQVQSHIGQSEAVATTLASILTNDTIGYDATGITGAAPGTFPTVQAQTQVVKIAVRFGS